jgi:hypothetical protein
MNNFSIETISDKIVLYYSTKEKGLSAYTLASTLISFADAARKANVKINPNLPICNYSANMEEIFTPANEKDL